MTKRKFGLYEISVVLFFLILPLFAVLIDLLIAKTPFSFFLLLKWSDFSIVGLRLISAGIKQVLTPEFTLKSIFEIEDQRATRLVTEIGFSNISIGTIGILSLFFSTFRLPISICGALYFLLCFLMHLKDKKKGELFSMLTDFYAFIILTLLIVLTLF